MSDSPTDHTHGSHSGPAGAAGIGRQGSPGRPVALSLLAAGLLALGSSSAAHAQLAVTDLLRGATPEALAAALVGEGVKISHVRYRGHPRAAGTFSGGTPILGFGSGIVLATGNAQTVGGDPDCSRGVEGPNTCHEPDGLANSTDFGEAGDPDLGQLAQVSTGDAAVLEFEFVPSFSTVTFRYVFSSEEYNDFANTVFNDAFGFFVNGANCALVPGTNQPVTVNTINRGNSDPTEDPTPHHPDLFRDNVRPGPTLLVQMDGLTAVLTCIASVVPGQLNSVKLAIADAGDRLFDSAVFIQAGSFVSDNTGAIVSTLIGDVAVTLPGTLPSTGTPSPLGYTVVPLVAPPVFLLSRGMRVVTGSTGQVSAACDDGSGFALTQDSGVFLDDHPCHPAGSGNLDLIRGQLRLAPGQGPALAGLEGAGPASKVRTPISDATTAGGAFTTTYSQVGSEGTAVTTAESGQVVVRDPRTGGIIAVAVPGSPATTTGPVPELVAATLPSSRSVQVGTTATAFATIINRGPVRAIGCAVLRSTDVPANFSFQPTDPATNQPSGATDTPVSIVTAQTFVVSLTPTAAFPPTEVALTFSCAGTEAPVTVGVNTVLLSGSVTPVPDVVAVAATVGNTGIVNVPGAGGTGAFAVATSNVGAAGLITASASFGGAALAATTRICQTNAATGQCLSGSALAPTATVQMAAGQTASFLILVDATGPIGFDPAANRVVVELRDAGGVVRGKTSVAVTTD